jgi:hypothetical protein
MKMKFACFLLADLLLLGAAARPAGAQMLPPTPQQLQQQHDQIIQKETNATHDNLTQLQIQQAQHPQPTPVITPSGRVIAHPPGYIPMPDPSR